MSTDMSDHDLLLRIDQRLQDLIKEIDKVSNGVGFPRCAERKAQIEELRSSVQWLKRGILGIPVTYVITEILKKLI